MDAMVYASGVPTSATLAQWPTMTARRVFVTPSMAADWLSCANIDNRHMRKTVVKRYADLMKANEWRFTHQGVAFSSRRLIDGQHRLAAVVESGKPQWMVVFVEQDDDVFGVLDRGARRELRDELQYDPRISDAVSWLARLTTPRGIAGQVSMAAARVIAMKFAPFLQEMVEASGSVAKGRTASPIRGSIALRIATSSKDDRLYLLKMWRAWTLLNFDDMSSSIKSGLKRLDAVQGTSSTQQLERACIAWQAFDPASRDLSRIIIRSSDAQISEMRAAIAAVMEAA